MDTISKTKKRPWVIGWLVLSQVLAAGTLVPWVVCAFYAYAGLLNGFSAWLSIFAGVVFSYPVVVIGCALQAWRLYRAHKDWQALIVTSLFLEGPLFVFLILFITSLPK